MRASRHFLKRVFKILVLSHNRFFQKIIFHLPGNLYVKTDGTSVLVLFLVKNFEEILFFKGWFCQKLPSNDNNNMGYSLLNPFFDATQNKLSND